MQASLKKLFQMSSNTPLEYAHRAHGWRRIACVTAIAGVAGLGFFVALTVLWRDNDAGPAEQSENSIHGEPTKSARELGGTEGASQLRRSSTEPVTTSNRQGVADLVRELLFSTDRYRLAADNILQGYARDELSVLETTQVILSELDRDQRHATPMLTNSYGPASIILCDDQPAGDTTSVALRYKAYRSLHPLHNELKVLLRGWPCETKAKCDAALLAELKGTATDDQLFALCRDLLDRGWEGGGQIVVRLLQDLCKDPIEPGGIRTNSELLATLLKYGQPASQYMEAMLRIPASLQNEHFAGSSPDSRVAMERAGVFGRGVTTFGFALGECLSNRIGAPRQLDRVALDSLLAYLCAFEGGGIGAQPVECAIALGLGCVVQSELAAKQLSKFVARGPSLQLQTTAMAQLGKFGSAAAVEAALTAAVARNPILARSSRLQIGYLGALDNGRQVNADCASKAQTAFETVLKSRDRFDDRAQSSVLEMLARNPMHALLGEIEVLAASHPRGSVRETAANALRATRQKMSNQGR